MPSALLSTSAPLADLPSLLDFCPALHYLVLVVLGPYHHPHPPTFTPHFFVWLFICGFGFGFFGPIIGAEGGGWTINLVQASLFWGAFVWFVLIRRSLSVLLRDLRPVLRRFVDAEHNSALKINRDRKRMTYLVGGLCCVGPAIGICIIIFFYTLDQAWINDHNSRPYIGVQGAAVTFFFVSFILKVQLSLLFAVAKLYIFRFHYLFSALSQRTHDNDSVLLAELSLETPLMERRLLATAPSSSESSPLSEGKVAYTLRPYGPSSSREAETAQLIDSHPQLNTFLRVYRAIKEEAALHAKSFSIPLMLFLIVYFFVFLLSVVTIIRDMITSREKSQPIRLEVVWVMLALGYIFVNLLPIISINSTWPRLMARPQAMLTLWNAQERLILHAYFTEHPLVFPVLGLTFTWNKV